MKIIALKPNKEIMHLTPDFSVHEFLVSKEYPELIKGISLPDNTLMRLKFLCQWILQPTRDKFGEITVISGYRTMELNLKVGGTPDSDHLYGCAADIVAEKANLKYVFLWIVNKSNFPFRQVIYYPQERFIHVSVNIPERPHKHEAFVKIEGVYAPFQKGEDIQMILEPEKLRSL